MRSRLKLSSPAACSSLGGDADLVGAVDAAEPLQDRASKLCAPSDTRLMPAARYSRESAALDRAGVRLQRDLRIAARACSAADAVEHVRERARREQAGRAAAEEHADDRATGERRRLLRRDRAAAPRCTRLRAASPCSVKELKSQYGHFCTHHGKCRYSDKRRQRHRLTRHCASSARSARPRWLTAFFSAALISAAVRVSPAGTNTGS